jgi:threonine dehydrogenase-like Zn-dependent dehydrogenase
VIQAPTDAVARVTLGCVCGSDLWYYRGDSPHSLGPIGHEFIGVINPGLVFDFETGLEGIAEAYQAMDERRAIKSVIRMVSA